MSIGEQAIKISIHALREEGDLLCVNARYYKSISIHALREEGDRGHGLCNVRRGVYFYPRPPRGGRQISLAHKSTPP